MPKILSLLLIVPVLAGMLNVSNGRTLDDIVSGIRRTSESFGKLPCWLVRYTETRESFSLPPGFRENRPKAEYINAQKGELLYLYRKMHEAQTTQLWVAWRDNVCTRRLLDHNYEVLPELSPDLFQCWHYTHDAFIDTHRNQSFRAPPIVGSFGSSSLSEAFWTALPRSIDRKRDEWTLSSQDEDVDGFKCAPISRYVDGVLKDSLWVDCDHGYICRKRCYNWSNNQPGIIWKNESLSEKAPGLWLPMRQAVHMYNTNDQPENVRGKLRYIQHFEVQDISFEILPDGFFVAPLIKDGLVTDSVRGTSYIVHSDKSKPEARAQEAIADAARVTHNGEFETSTAPTGIVLYGHVIVVLGILLACQVRWMRESRNV